MAFMCIMIALAVLGLQENCAQEVQQNESATLIPEQEKSQPAFVGRSSYFAFQVEYKPDPCYAKGKCPFYLQASRYVYNGTTDTCSMERVCNYLGFATQQDCLFNCLQQ